MYEAELPPEAQRPGVPRTRSDVVNREPSQDTDAAANDAVMDDRSVLTPDEPGPDDSVRVDAPTIEVPLAVAHVYNLEVISTSAGMEMPPPENPTVKQLKTNVTVRLPPEGGRLERIPNTRRVAFLERDRFGVPKRTVWVDKQGKVFAEVVEDEDDESTSRGNTIRLGLVRIFIDALVVVVVFILYVCVGSN